MFICKWKALCRPSITMKEIMDAQSVDINAFALYDEGTGVYIDMFTFHEVDDDIMLAWPFNFWGSSSIGVRDKDLKYFSTPCHAPGFKTSHMSQSCWKIAKEAFLPLNTNSTFEGTPVSTVHDPKALLTMMYGPSFEVDVKSQI